MVQGSAPYGAPQFQAPQATPPGPALPPAGPPAPVPYPGPPPPGPYAYPPPPVPYAYPPPGPYGPSPARPQPPSAPRSGLGGYEPSPHLGAPPQRPAVITVASTLAVVASLQWICGLSLLWVTAVVGIGTFSQAGDNGAVFHILNRFNYRMLDGLAIPLYLFPLASLVTGFLVLSRRRWTRMLHAAVGLAALVWGVWWLQGNLLWWFSGAWYVVVACLVLWTPSATAWYRWREPGPPRR